ncbi:MAG: GNAT family N-acetyltransferase [Anaerolineales bacterium]|nr:GNAT family N-acetyltransferase [Anaerolineales bacterium]
MGPLLAYSEGYPVGWIAVEPRSHYPKLAHSRVLNLLMIRKSGRSPVFCREKHRRKNITVELLKAAIEHVKRMADRSSGKDISV